MLRTDSIPELDFGNMSDKEVAGWLVALALQKMNKQFYESRKRLNYDCRDTD
jgi:hypothetical protein